MALGKNGKQEEKVQVIVSIKEFEQMTKASSNNYYIKYVLPMIDSVVVEVSKDQTAELFSLSCGLHNEMKVEMDSVIQAQMNRAGHIVQLDAAREEEVYGEGVGVAVLDTGVFPHADLVSGKNRIIAFYDVVNGRRFPYDDNGHGTHV